MRKVEPVQSVKKINSARRYYMGTMNIKDYAILSLKSNLSLNTSDILNLKWKDVFDFEENHFKRHIYFKRNSSNQSQKFILNSNSIMALLKYKVWLGHINACDYIFKK